MVCVPLVEPAVLGAVHIVSAFVSENGIEAAAPERSG